MTKLELENRKTELDQLIADSLLTNKSLSERREWHSELWEVENQLKRIEKQQIRKYANQHGWSDVYPFEVIRKITDRCVEVRAMKSEQTVFPKEFHVGGFSAHCADQHSQEYKYESNPDAEVFKIRWSKAKSRWQDRHGRRFIMCDKPVKFYDYNF